MIRRAIALLALGASLMTPPAPRAQTDDAGGYHLSLGYDGRLLVKVLDIQVDAYLLNAKDEVLSARAVKIKKQVKAKLATAVAA